MNYIINMEIDDLFNRDDKKKKKINSGNKGKNGERELCKLLTERFGQTFTRSVGSGNRWSQVANMPAHAIATYSGDLVPPSESFLWVIECKMGYPDIDLSFALVDGN